MLLNKELGEYQERERIALNNKLKLESKMDAVDNLKPDARFDRLKFVYETNIDMIEILQTKHRNTYNEIRQEYKSMICPKMEHLLKESTDVIKRLYPSKQPEVF